jgi:VWFA-related protein
VYLVISRFGDFVICLIRDGRAKLARSRFTKSPNHQITKFVCAAIVLLAAVLAGHAASQDQSQPTFRTGVQVVEVDVRVFGRDGRFVPDLTRDDFELVEDGTAQQIQTVFLVDGAGSRGAGSGETASPPETAAAGRPASPPASARQTWIFMFDLNHLAPAASFDRARRAVEEFVRTRLREGDLAGVVAGTKMVNNRLTSVREELVAAVAGLKPLPDARTRQLEMSREWPRLLNEAEAFLIANENRDAIQRAVMRACAEDQSACRQVPPDNEVRQKARRLVSDFQRATAETLQAVNALASGLAKMAGPKTIVFLTEGFVAQEMEAPLRTVVGQVARAGARVYAIDVRGLNRTGGGIIDQQLASDESGSFAQLDSAEDGPNSLAVDTGGMIIRNENNITRALQTVADDAGRYYVLAYQPVNTAFDGKFRSIEVRVKRNGVRVRSRRGYLALEPSKMLTPRPVTPTPSLASGGARRNEAAAPPHDTTATAAPATATGTVVNPATTTTEAVRLRPDSTERVEMLAAGNTGDAGARARVGWEAYQRGDIEAAIGPLTEAAAASDARPWVLYALGFSQVALGRPADAVASWERVRSAAPEFQDVYVDLADAYVQLSDTTKALAVLREAGNRWPESDEVHNAIGVIHVRRGAIDEAIVSFDKAVKAAPGEALGYLNLGRAYELRYARGRRWVASQRRWVAPEDDRQRAAESYQQCVRLGGPYAAQASEALSRLEWSK